MQSYEHGLEQCFQTANHLNLTLLATGRRKLLSHSGRDFGYKYEQYFRSFQFSHKLQLPLRANLKLISNKRKFYFILKYPLVMEFLLPLLNPHAFQQGRQGFGPFGQPQTGFGFGQQQCGQSQDMPCSSQQAKARASAAAAAEQFGFDPAEYGFNLEDFVGTAAAFLASLAEAAQAQNKSSPKESREQKDGFQVLNVVQPPLELNFVDLLSINAFHFVPFQMKFDVAQFKPEELTVKTVDNFIVLEGIHEEREDGNGFVSRQFTRRIQIPAGIDAEGIKCDFTASGQLVISAPKLAPVQSPPVAEDAKTIPIQQENNGSSKADAR